MKRKMKSVILKHDGAPPHYSCKQGDFINQTLPEGKRVIGRGICIPVATKVSD